MLGKTGRLILLIALGAVLTAFPAGCRLGSEPDSTIRLAWWITYAEESAEYAAFETIAQAYGEQTDNIVVDLVSVPWDDIAPRGVGATKLTMAQESGVGPDLWGPVPHSWTGSFALAEQALPLEAAHIPDRDQYVSTALAACRYEGQQYGLPVLMDALALIHNRELVPKPPNTFAELLTVAKELTDAEEDRWGLVFPLLSQYHVYPFIDGYGGYTLGCDAEGCDLADIGLDSEGAVRGTQLLSELYVSEGLFPQELTDRSVMDDHARRLFAEGRAAMLIDGPWALPEIREGGVDYGVASIPSLPDTDRVPRSLTLVDAMYVSAHSAHPQEALALLGHIASIESVTTLQRALGKAPVRRDILYTEAYRNDREVRAWRNEASRGVPLPNVPELGYVWLPWAQALDEAIPGYTPAQEALDRAVEQIKGYIEDDTPQ